MDFNLKKNLVPKTLDFDIYISLYDNDGELLLRMEEESLEKSPGSELVLCRKTAYKMIRSLNTGFGGTICSVPGRNDTPAAFQVASVQVSASHEILALLRPKWSARSVMLNRLIREDTKFRPAEIVNEDLQGIVILYGSSNDSLAKLLAKRTEALFASRSAQQDGCMHEGHKPQWLPVVMGPWPKLHEHTIIHDLRKVPWPSELMTADQWKCSSKCLSPDGRIRFTSHSFLLKGSNQQCVVSAWGILIGPLSTSHADIQVILCIDADVTSSEMTGILTEAKERVFSRCLMGNFEGRNDRLIMLSKRNGALLSQSELDQVRTMTLKACENLRELMLRYEEYSEDLFEVRVKNAADRSVAEKVARAIGTNRDIRATAVGYGQDDGCAKLGQVTLQILQHMEDHACGQSLLGTTTVSLSSLDGEGDFVPETPIADVNGVVEPSAQSAELFSGGGLCLTIDFKAGTSEYTYLSTAAMH